MFDFLHSTFDQFALNNLIFGTKQVQPKKFCKDLKKEFIMGIFLYQKNVAQTKTKC